MIPNPESQFQCSVLFIMWRCKSMRTDISSSSILSGVWTDDELIEAQDRSKREYKINLLRAITQLLTDNTFRTTLKCGGVLMCFVVFLIPWLVSVQVTIAESDWKTSSVTTKSQSAHLSLVAFRGRALGRCLRDVVRCCGIQSMLWIWTHVNFCWISFRVRSLTLQHWT